MVIGVHAILAIAVYAIMYLHTLIGDYVILVVLLLMVSGIMYLNRRAHDE